MKTCKTGIARFSKSDRRSLERKADRLWSKAILERDKGTCRKCGRPGNNPHHIFSRSIKHMRHDLDNGLCLCPACHTLGPQSAHKAPEFFRDWLIVEIGQRTFGKLKTSASMAYKPDYQAAILWLTDWLRNHE
jgi:hypothetical protein